MDNFSKTRAWPTKQNPLQQNAELNSTIFKFDALLLQKYTLDVIVSSFKCLR